MPCLLRLTPPETRQRPVIARRQTYGTIDQTLLPEQGGWRPRGVGINCLVALQRDAWRIEFRGQTSTVPSESAMRRSHGSRLGPHGRDQSTAATVRDVAAAVTPGTGAGAAMPATVYMQCGRPGHSVAAPSRLSRLPGTLAAAAAGDRDGHPAVTVTRDGVSQRVTGTTQRPRRLPRQGPRPTVPRAGPGGRGPGPVDYRRECRQPIIMITMIT